MRFQKTHRTLTALALATSPDRLDALVWGLTELLVEPMPSAGIFEYYRNLAADAQAKKAASEATQRHPALQ